MANNYVKFRRGTPAAFQTLLKENKTELDTLYFIYEEDEAVGELYLGSKLIAGGSTIEGAQFLSELQDVLLDSQLETNDCLIYDISVDGGKWVNKPIVDILPIFVGANGNGSLGVPGLVPATETDDPTLFLRSDGKWAEVVTASIETDNITLENIDGVLSIVGFKDAPEGAQPVKNEDGSLGWVKPDLTTIETLQEDIENIEQILSPTDEEGNPVEGGLIAEVAKKADATEVQAALDTKANADDVAAALDLKADAEAVNADLALKANSADVNAALDLKANTADVESALELKANAKEIQDALDLKADTKTVNEALALKANAEDVNTALNLKANAADVYTKTETDNAIATSIGEAIANVDHLSREVVDVLPDAADANPNIIYMVPSGLLEDDNKYYEWILIDGVFEQVGSWEVDLKEYAKTSDVETALDGKVDKDGDSRLMTSAEGVKLAGIAEGAEANYINSVDTEFKVNDGNLSLVEIAQTKVSGLVNKLDQITTTLASKVDTEEGSRLIKADEISKLAAIKDLIQSVDTAKFTIDENGKLLLNNIDIEEVVDLADALAGKVDKVEGSRLITEEEGKKLDALVLEEGKVEISGTVNAANVQELYNAVVNIVTGTGTGLYDDVQKTLLGIEAGAEKNYINSVNEAQLIVEDRSLSIKSIEIGVVSGLQALLDTTSQSVVDLEGRLNALAKTVDAHEDRLSAVEDQLIWKPLTDEII